MSCSNSVNGMAAFDCRNGNEYGLLRGCILVTSDFAIPLANAGTKSYWTAHMIAGRAYPVHGFVNVEDASKAPDEQEFPLGGKATLMDGLRGFKAYLNLPLDAHKTLQSYQDNFTHVVLYDNKGNLMGTNDGTNFKGTQINTLEAHSMNVGLPGNKPLSSFTLVEKYSDEWDLSGMTIQPYKGTLATRWTPESLSSITRVTVTQSGTIAANAYIVDVAFKSLSDVDNTGTYVINRAVTGLVDANFQSKNGSGVIVAITNVAESGTVPGRYTVTHASFTAGTSQVKPSSTMLFDSEVLTLA